MAVADSYWMNRLKRDHALAQRSAKQVQMQVRAAYRAEYVQVAHRLDSLYAEAMATGELSRTQLWNYLSYVDLEQELSRFCEMGSLIEREKLTTALDKFFLDTIGAPAEQFQRRQFILRYDPRAVIDTAWSGENYSTRIWKHNTRLAQQIRDQAQQMMMGLRSPGEVKRQLMRDFDVTYSQAERLVDTEFSYVLNKANEINYERMDVKKICITTLDVNTCDRCKAIEGEVFDIADAPVLPIHPRCHCAYCVPRDGDAAEITASGAALDELYERKDVKLYGQRKKRVAVPGLGNG